MTAGFANGTATGCVAKVNPEVCSSALTTGYQLKALSRQLYPAQLPGGPGRLPGGHGRRHAEENDTIGAIGGITLRGACIRHIQGYELVAKSINPDINVAMIRYESDF